VPEDHASGPSAGIAPKRDSGRHSMPSSDTGQPPRWASHVTAISASRMPAQRSSGSWSASATARITVRMSNGFLRPGFVSSEKISPTVLRSEPGASCGVELTSRSLGSLVSARRGKRSPGAR